jgi:hypothetical protein
MIEPFYKVRQKDTSPARGKAILKTVAIPLLQ